VQRYNNFLGGKSPQNAIENNNNFTIQSPPKTRYLRISTQNLISKISEIHTKRQIYTEINFFENDKIVQRYSIGVNSSSKNVRKFCHFFYWKHYFFLLRPVFIRKSFIISKNIYIKFQWKREKSKMTQKCKDISLQIAQKFVAFSLRI